MLRDEIKQLKKELSDKTSTITKLQLSNASVISNISNGIININRNDNINNIKETFEEIISIDDYCSQISNDIYGSNINIPHSMPFAGNS